MSDPDFIDSSPDLHSLDPSDLLPLTPVGAEISDVISTHDNNEDTRHDKSPSPVVVEEHLDLKPYLKKRIALSQLTSERYTPEVDDALDRFASDVSQEALFVYFDPQRVLHAESSAPAQNVEQLFYFIRKERAPLTPENLEENLQFGSVRGSPTASLLRLMNGIYTPYIFGNTSWPESIRNNFSANFHHFMTSLTDTRYNLQGQTVFYIPIEAMNVEAETAIEDKPLVQRLEITMVHWTRQIKEFLRAKEAVEMGESLGPLEVIEFWREQCTDLSGISKQLDKPGVKHIEHILKMAKSSYVEPFQNMSQQIQVVSAQAQSNLSFLSILQEPFKELMSLKLKNIPEKLPHLLNLVRIIWVNSPYYNTQKLITSLFRKISNELIQLCSREISLDHIFDGYIASSRQVLKDCILCCTAWKEQYMRAVQVHQRFSKVGWVLDQTSIFAQVDAFVRRCNNLLEVCLCQQQFGRWEDGQQTPLPCFPGQSGPQITSSLLEIEDTFQKNLLILKAVKETILDLKNATWHDNYYRFRASMKDLEVMMKNLIVKAFETVRSVEQGVELLDFFHHLSAREAIKRTFDKKTVQVYEMFKNELDLVKKELGRKIPTVPSHMSHSAGQAHWVQALRRRIDRPMQILAGCHFMPRVGVGEEVIHEYQQLTQKLDELLRKIFLEWSQLVDRQAMKRLDIPLMVRSQEKPGMLDVNFDKDVLKLFVEIHYWERAQFEIPHYVVDIYQRQEELRNLRENVLLVVRAYNRIIAALSTEEHSLFRERIRFLDKKIQPGLTKLHWSSKGASSAFINDCLLHASEIQQIVDNYKASNLNISHCAQMISVSLLLHIDGNRVFRDMEFQEAQEEHRRAVQSHLQKLHEEICSFMRTTYEVLKADGPEVQQHWIFYTKKIDHLVEEAFRLNIKWSLQELSNAINGDSKTSPSPLFQVMVILQNDFPGSTAEVEFSPTLLQLANIVNRVCSEILIAISSFKRLPDILTKEKSSLDPIHNILERDEEIKKIQALISGGMATNATLLQAYQKTWDSFRMIWEPPKDTLMRRYRRLNPMASAFDADMVRYKELVNSVQKQETIQNIQFVMLDCSQLKFALLQHCNEWQNKFTGLLRQMATEKLVELHAYLRDNAERVIRSPQTLGELAQSLTLYDTLQSDLSKVESQIMPIHDQFEILKKYDVAVDESVLNTLASLNKAWLSFQQSLIDSETMLNKSKEKFKAGLIHTAEEFKKKSRSLLEDFAGRGPVSSSVGCEPALEQIAMFRQMMNTFKEEENTIRSGLSMFKIEQPGSKDIQAMEKDLDSLQLVWEVTKEWEQNWGDWKSGRFLTLQPEIMENTAQGLFKRLSKLSRELKEKNWEVVETSRMRIDQFKRTLPLIVDLRNPALRERHWTQIKQEIQRPFDQTGDDFTLEKIVELGLDHHVEKINEISTTATKELSIEQALENFTRTWENTKLDIVSYKDKGHYLLRGTDEVFQALEDNQVSISTMKASPFVKAFELEVDRWERCLSHILEVIETILTLQRQWLYLENIFMGEDIRKQLPQELFDQVNINWKNIMDRLNKDNNALSGTHFPGLLEKLGEMNAVLEGIQKSLDLYLETKRQIFPRFYFLSNDDLLEILGQSRNPEAVQPHLKKCFDNIKSLKIQKAGNKYEGAGMFSAEGEYVEFKHPVPLEGPVETWLCDIERTMRWTLRELLRNCRLTLKKMSNKRDKWVKEWAGQMLITASQIQWTTDVTKSLVTAKERADKSSLKIMKKKQVSILHKYSDTIRGNLTKILRLKLVALVTVEVHARDVIDKMLKSGCTDVASFEWLSQLRFYWHKGVYDCIISQTNTHFQYGYEYLGNSGRLVITPLTDRCYMTLTTALHLHRGGSPMGPAGTGKTETVKDLGKALGMYVIVVNCSEGLDYKSMARMYSGLAQTGAWGCFDEFNRINIEVLSVVAQQILSILSALSANLTRFVFEGRDISLVGSCGIFITMNPGYAGRTELPDNLKSMFRPISMVVPDSTLIAEIILFSEGFSNCKLLAKKVYTLYSLAVQQLSKQDHYDFGLRALTSLLRYAGCKRRLHPDLSDEEILIMSMKDMNIAKLTSVDLPLFIGIMHDLFPGIDAPSADYGKLREQIEQELRLSGLQITLFTVNKVIQLYETKSSRHSCMIIGRTCSGKTTTWRCLQSALSSLHRSGDTNYNLVREFPLNPKAVSLGELYGEYDLTTSEWTDGILSSLMRTACADERPDEKWIVFDGPVDTLWIESINSVMDDNKVLTLINGERIAMPEQVSLLFEVADLAVASPATVSRCGMVFTDHISLGWKPYVQSWLEKRSKVEAESLKRMFDKYVGRILEYKHQNCKDLVPQEDTSGVISLCKLYESLATPENGVNPADQDNYSSMVELWFLFCLVWSVCASVDEDGRKKIDNYLRGIEGSFPYKDTVYEYFVDPKTKNWMNFEDRLPKHWRIPANFPFYKIMVPTVDTVRYQFIVSALVTHQNPVLLVGPVGTGKTSIAQSVLQSLDANKWTLLTVNMSAQTSSSNVQNIIESRVEKRTKGVYVPAGRKHLLTFVDDLNMPAKDTFGSQPPLELLRLWIDYGFWYDRQNQSSKYVKDMFIMAAMGPPGGGRTAISGRLQSRFNLINMTFPSESQIKRIFGTMMSQKLQLFEEDVKPVGDIITQATVELYNAVTQRFLPTPAKIHYLFNLRDISKVFQGMLRAHRDLHDTKHSMTKLWVHECFRVFSDRLVDSSDTEAFIGILSEKLGSLFDLTYHNLCPSKQPPVFGDFMGEPPVYEDITDFGTLKKFMMTQQEELTQQPGTAAKKLVLFTDAIQHMTRIVRVIGQPRGNMLLVGIGGSGRQSLARLASYICEYKVFQLEVTRGYRRQEFREDIKKLYQLAGVDGRPSVFLLTDIQITEEAFLEDVNNILSSGEVPNLYKADEFEEIRSLLQEKAKEEGVPDNPESLFNFLIERVRNNLHIVLCMSPVGDPFRNRIRQYPALVNCTTIDWFSEWPQEALLEVAERYLEGVELGNMEGVSGKVARIFVTMHRSVAEYSHKMKLELRRHNYITPTSYLGVVSRYKSLLNEKRTELGEKATKLRNGLFKIEETREKVEKMSEELAIARSKVAEFQKQCDEYLVMIVQQRREANEQQMTVTAHSERIGAEEIKCKALADNAQKDLEEALPALEEAMKALETLNKRDLTEIRAYGRPPALVETVMKAVMTLRGNEPTWAEAKRQLGEPNFIKQLINFDKDNIPERVLKKIGQYCVLPDFQPDIVGRVSLAARSLCMWVRAMEMYGRIFRVVEPKRARMNAAMAQLAEKQASLAEAQNKLREVGERLEQLKMQYGEKLAQKEALRAEAELMEVKLQRAGTLVTGLAGEKSRWEETLKGLDQDLGFLVGDCLLASAFLSYMGPFLSNYRDEILSIWIKRVKEMLVPCSPEFDLSTFLSSPTMVREWNLQGLPSDSFSSDNGVIVTRGNRWPLMIDPQGQASKWIKSMESAKGLKVIDLQMTDFMRTLEQAVQFGTPVLLQNVQEELDPLLAPILNKSVAKVGGKLQIRLGDKDFMYNPEFRFYITTKLSNPHYTPEISSQITIVNFAVKEQGLEAQLLGSVVKKERPELEDQKQSLVLNIAAGKRKLQDLEDEILRLLNEATGSLLDDVQLENTLQTSKVTATEVSKQLESSEETEEKIDLAREAYRPCAQRASLLFFVLNDLGRIDPMYQFSLDSYIDLFHLCIDKSKRNLNLDERIANLNEYHTYAVYRYTCRALFERHKLLFSFQMCAKILEVEGKLNMDEYNFFLRGGVVLDREEQMDNPCPGWLSDANWDNITELDKLTNFHGIMNSFEQYPCDWNQWYTSPEPESACLPGEWENACSEVQRMLIVRSLRQDRVAFCVTAFIINNLGSKFTEPPVLDMRAVVDDSLPRSPLVFVLSPGVDPTGALQQLAEQCHMSQRFQTLSLGQGQAPIATRMIKEGVKEGQWVFLANCHLSLSWMPQLDKLVEQLQVENPHPSFRLWLSSSPHPEFPISILQASIKMTTEPPKGLRANMTRLYQLITEPQFSCCTKTTSYRCLLFSLCFFHSILLERRKFLQLGWNIVYGFNDSDFEVSENLLSLNLDEYKETPWEALKYLISEVNYGGHVTDDWDRRLLRTYINDYFCEQALTTQFYKLSSLDAYYIPCDGPLPSYKEFISLLPTVDHPEAFGQHPNVDIASQITEAQTLFDTLLSLQPQVTQNIPGGQSREDKVLELLSDVRQKIPQEIDYERTVKVLSDDPNPLNVVLLQEIQRYNALLSTIRSSLQDLEYGIQGLVVMSPELEEMFTCIYDARVPPLWEKVSVDSLSWEFIVSTVDDNNLVYPPKDGVWIRGLYLEGAGWDKKNSCLMEAEPMQLVCPLPTVHFRPTESKKKSSKGLYPCPCYYYPIRSGSSGRASFVIGVDLRTGASPPEHWIKRGTALLMSLDS